MKRITKLPNWAAISLLPILFIACKKNDVDMPASSTKTISIENVLDSRSLVQSGKFQGTGSPALILPGQSTTIHFSAAKGEALSFATMYGWSNDLFFAPANPGILVYDASGNPIEGDVSAQIKLWDNGTRVNQAPGAAVNHPGVAESRNITEVSGTDAQGNAYLPAAALVKASLKYDGNSYFTLTLENISIGKANQTPLSPGVWAVSYIVGGNLLNPAPIYSNGKPTANGLTNIAEAGDNAALGTYISSNTGIFTPLSPVLVVVYSGIENPIFKLGEYDRGKGLTYIAQRGNADTLFNAFKKLPGIKSVYVLAEPTNKVLLPMINGAAGGMVSQSITVNQGDRLAIATMYGFSNDWFFTNADNGVDATVSADISSTIKLYNDGTAVDQFPGAGITQFNLAGTPLSESKVISEVPNPNAFTTLPAIQNFIKVIIK